MQFKISVEKEKDAYFILRHELEKGIADVLNKGTFAFINADFRLMVSSLKRTCDGKNRSVIAETPSSITFFVNEKL